MTELTNTTGTVTATIETGKNGWYLVRKNGAVAAKSATFKGAQAAARRIIAQA